MKEYKTHIYKELAIRLYDLLDPWERDPSKSKAEEIADIVKDIEETPEAVIGHLLDIIDNYTS